MVGHFCGNEMTIQQSIKIKIEENNAILEFIFLYKIRMPF
jgi:hypothetical protein